MQPSLRPELERLLGESITDSEWRYLYDEGHVDQVANGHRDILWLVDRTYALWRAASRKPSRFNQAPKMLPRQEEWTPQTTGERIGAHILAQHVAESDVVTRFRREIFNGHQYPHFQVGGWIEQQRQKDGARTEWIECPVPTGVTIDCRDDEGRGLLSEPLRMLLEGSRVTVKLLAYSAPDDPWVRRVPVTHGGALDRLRSLSRALHEQIGWSEAAATVFVITGLVPVMPRLDVHVDHLGGLRPQIHVRADLTVSPEQVAEAVRGQREDFKLGRPRSLSPRHLALAAFSTHRSRETWSLRLAAWNTKYPDWAYAQDSNFRRDYLKARQRVLGLPQPIVRDVIDLLPGMSVADGIAAASSVKTKSKGRKPAKKKTAPKRPKGGKATRRASAVKRETRRNRT